MKSERNKPPLEIYINTHLAGSGYFVIVRGTNIPNEVYGCFSYPREGFDTFKRVIQTRKIMDSLEFWLQNSIGKKGINPPRNVSVFVDSSHDIGLKIKNNSHLKSASNFKVVLKLYGDNS